MGLTHVILIRPNPETTPEQHQVGIDALLALKDKIPAILDVEAHKSVKVDARGGFTDIMIFKFENEEQLAIYSQHPEHLAVVQANRPFVASLVAFDYI